jgi:hypothetical protein
MTSATLETTALEIIRAALQDIGEADAEQPLDASQFADGLRDLNYMVKSWQSQGLHLWTKTEAILFLDVGTESYDLGPGGDRACLADDFIDTTLTADVLGGNAVLPVASSSGMVSGDQVGVKLTNNTRQWSTILTVDSSTQITLSDNLTADADSGATVFTYTSLIDRPLRILQLRRFTVGENDEIEAIQWSRQEYFAQPDKSSQGQINNWYYSPQLTKGRVYIWQVADDVNRIAKFTFERPINVTESTSEKPDFPSEWFDVLKTNLASRIAIQYRVPADRRLELKDEAAYLLGNALGYDREPDSFNVQPDFRF